jgi:DNA-binding MarR family transcriptional regulator
MINRQARGGAHIPEPGEGKRGPSGNLGYLLRQASAAVRHNFDRSLADLNVTGAQYAALVMVGAYPELSSADVARLSTLTPQTVNVIVRNLEARGALTRRPHSVHGRILVLELTPEGRRLLAQCRKRAKALEVRLMRGFANAKEEEAVRRWLVFCATALEGP